MIKGILGLYSWQYPRTVVYMLQSSEYHVWTYLKWYWQTGDFTKVMKRRALNVTRAAQLLLAVLYTGIIVQIAVGLTLLVLFVMGHTHGTLPFGLALIVSAPFLWAQLIVIPLVLGRWLWVKPRSYFLVKESEALFRDHKGIKIAVAGSYGKTTMKELLATVLGASKSIAVTPGNKNVSISHAHFAKKLSGNEDILIIEYGEGAPGDVARFAQVTHPTHAVIAGLAPAHLDRYKTLKAAGEDIFSVAEYVEPHHAFVNSESPETKPFMKKSFERYDEDGALGWKVSQVKTDIHGLSFTMKHGKKTMHLKSELIGKYQVGPLAFVAAFAEQLGLHIADIEAAIGTTRPFEHRMQQYPLGGAWVIDDTYNGNIEGIRAGTELLAELPAKRKIYVTPGLVDQGRETRVVHEQMGAYIAKAKPDVVVLMKNSVTHHIQHGLKSADFKGELVIEDNPLRFYTSLSLFVAAGDLLVMQNDWPDNYA
jgi:UDP-N-acetylmuramoyl-tripeptide--D-alanyl-D-alanine ligase